MFPFTDLLKSFKELHACHVEPDFPRDSHINTITRVCPIQSSPTKDGGIPAMTPVATLLLNFSLCAGTHTVFVLFLLPSLRYTANVCYSQPIT